ncbi:agmatine deiminase [Nonomuraea pusilla]|uniref:agmatine deiminase n=1 Tax=Nonomuraea pusilla TaxID=46177 RepID=UPI003320955D
MRTLTGTPADDGFRMPAEWEPHEGCWMLWPERPDNWRAGAKPAQAAFAAVAHAIADAGDPVTVGVSAAQFRHARASLSAAIRVVELSFDDAWIRDTGPTFVVDDKGGRRGVDWVFNAWGGLEGGLYFPWDADDQVAGKVLEIERSDRYRAPFVLEGGSIHVDGEGTCLTTEQCLLNPNRNPGRSREQLERLLSDHLGIERVIWLGAGVHADETDGHIDNLACFVRPGVVCLTWTDDEQDPQHAISRDALERLERATDARGRALEVHKVPMPGPLRYSEEEARGIDRRGDGEPWRLGLRMPGSYVNFYVANRGVVVPLLDPLHDDQVVAQLGKLFPGREVIGVPAREVLLGGGNVHCVTQQVPAPRPWEN